jgi:hypothetical protein
VGKRGKDMHNKKSQAALEFLTTYAWAFLVILIMVGALAYFGVLSPSKLLPDRCNFGSEVSCDKNRMKVDKSDTGPKMALTNNFGTAVTIKTIRVINSNTGQACDGETNDPDTPTITPPDSTVWPSGGTITLTATGCGTLIENEKIKFSVEIDYYAVAAGEDYTKTVFGEIYSSVVDSTDVS